MKGIKLLTIFIFLVGATSAPAQKAKNFFKDKTKIDNPFGLRDPFKSPTFKTEGKREGRGFSVTGKGQYSNIAEQNLEQLSVTNIKVLGVLIGRERRAMVTTAGGGDKPVTPAPGASGGSKGGSKIIVLKEGQKVGAEGAELKAILPGGIILVEKIVNVYGEEEYLETVIPISR